MAKLWKRAVAFATLIAVLDGEAIIAFVAKAILFKQAERIVSAQEFGGYRANIVTYTIALLAHYLRARRKGLAFDGIWQTQAITADTRTTGWWPTGTPTKSPAWSWV